MPLLQTDQRTDAWREARRGKITASIAAACLRLDPYNSPQKAWRSIRGDREEENAAMRWGNQNEAGARQAFAAQWGYPVQPTGFWIHPEHDWLGASPDGLIGDDGLVEIKCPGRLPQKVPVHHRIQMLLQLEVAQRRWCDYFAWTEQDSFCCRVWAGNCRGLIHRLRQFYDAYVLPGIEPPRKKRRKK